MSTIAVAKSVMNWQSASQRQSCHNCVHVSERVARNLSSTWCESGGFFTQPMAICARFARADQAPAVMDNLPATMAPEAEPASEAARR